MDKIKFNVLIASNKDMRLEIVNNLLATRSGGQNEVLTSTLEVSLVEEDMAEVEKVLDVA